MPDMDVAVGIGRPVVEDEAGTAFGGRPQPPVKIELPPALKDFRLLLRQAGAHRKVGFRQKQRFAVIARLFGLLIHGAPSNKPVVRRKGQNAPAASLQEPVPRFRVNERRNGLG